jgi:sirohydrochlorin cobaltochelatase
VGSEDALLLVAHGSARYSGAGRIAQAHLDRIRRSDPARQMALGLLNGAPSVAEALAGLTAPIVRVVPFFMEDGYFTKVAVPRALEATGRITTGQITTGQTTMGQIRLCPPVGVHDGMADLIIGCALDGCAAQGLAPARTAVLVVGHGSARAPGRPLALHRHTARARAAGSFLRVDSACLEEAPFVADTLRGLRDHIVAVVGFFAGEGGHVRDDLPGLVAAEQAARACLDPRVHIFAAAAENPSMSSIILAQASMA